MEGPLLLAANHPNSFLDAIILCTLFDRPVYSLARGDSFKNKLIAKLLYALKILPVYRVSEGVENLEENYKTFDACKQIFKQNGIVLIFSEGRCINEWHLRPLKKGTARLAISSWEDGIDLKVLPVGINYSSFKKFGKNVKLFFGELITKNTNGFNNSQGKSIKAFNENLEGQLKPFVFEIASDDKQKLKQEFYIAPSFLKKIVLFTPALIGLVVHAPLHYGIIFLNKKIVKEAGHFDSIMTGMWFFCYPVFLLLLTAIIYFVTNSLFSILLLIVLPFTAWAFVQLKQQLD
jgi:1-acyl-sn-glycerol-3-phosphate acyltransferase